MVLENSDVEALIKNGTQQKIKSARKKADHVNMHVTGKGLIKYLEKLDDYENEAQKLLREKLAKSNKANFSFILRPTDKIFTAKGGSINYNLPEAEVKKVKEQVSNISDGLDIRKYLKKVVKKHYIIDPNAILFCDLNKDGFIETYVITTHEIFWYETKGNKVEAIIFAPYEKEGEEGKLFYRVIDSATDRIFVSEQKNSDMDVKVVGSETLDNFFGFVPALVLGDEKDPNEDIFESIVSDLLDDADILLRRMSIMNVHDLAQLYPRYWALAQACVRCEGEGTIDRVVDRTTDPPTVESITCPSCGGHGQKQRTNASDETVVPWPEPGESIPNKIMGFESPDLQTAAFYDTAIKESCDAMYKSMWGTTYESGGKRETATGRALDAQPASDRLKDMSDTFSTMHKFLLDCYVKVLLRRPDYESSVTYGTRYIFDSPDDLLQRYIEVTRENTSDITRFDVLMRYIESQYKDDPKELLKRKRLLKLEPLPTMSIDKVMESSSIPPSLKERKMHFAMWVNTINEEELILLTFEQLKQNFNTYINQNSTNEDREALSGAGVSPQGMD